MARTLLLGLTCSLLVAATAVGAARRRPDLGMLKVTVMTDEVTAGGHLRISDRVGNAGRATARPTKTGYYLSVDSIKSRDDIRLGQRTVHRVRPGKAARGSATLTVPYAVGLFQVIACADDRRRVRESDERNNCRAASRDIHISAP